MHVGDYVRTEDGFIARLIDKDNWYKFDGIIAENEYSYDYLSEKLAKELIVKSSPNIIDLIEVGDYVNGSKLLSIEHAEDRQGNCDKAHFYYSFEDNDKDINEYYEELIVKSIVTKEQFSAMEYKVESEVK